MRELGATAFPSPLIAGSVVVCDLVVLDQHVVTIATHTQLTVVMDVVAGYLGAVGCLDTDAVIVSDLVVSNNPVGTIGLPAGVVAGVDGPHLRRIRILLDHQTGDGDATDLTLESDFRHRRFHSLTGRVVADVDAI